MTKLDHVKIAVSDWQVSRDWYRKHFAFKVEFEVTNGGDQKLGVAAMQDASGITLFLEQARVLPGSCACVLYFQVDNVDETYCHLSASNIRFLQPPQKLYWGYGAELADPDGHIIRIWDEKSMRDNEDQH